MAAPQGNKNAVGNSGGKPGRSGRKSAYQELADATEAYRIFFEEYDQEELEEKIRTGKFSLADRFILTGMEGDTAVINKAYHKAVPDNLDITSKGDRVEAIMVEIIKRNEAQSKGNDGVREELPEPQEDHSKSGRNGKQ